jgi:hypothetical protein
MITTTKKDLSLAWKLTILAAAVVLAIYGVLSMIGR